MDDVNYKFFHHLYDTLVLLGAPPDIATMVRNPDVTTEADVEEVRRLNSKLVAETKQKLIDLNKITIATD